MQIPFVALRAGFRCAQDDGCGGWSFVVLGAGEWHDRHWCRAAVVVALAG